MSTGTSSRSPATSARLSVSVSTFVPPASAMALDVPESVTVVGSLSATATAPVAPVA